MYPAGSSVRPLAPGPQSDESWREGKVKRRGQQAQETLRPPEVARVWAARPMRRLSQLGQGIVSAAESAPRVMTLLKPVNTTPGTGWHYPTPRGLSDTFPPLSRGHGLLHVLPQNCRLFRSPSQARLRTRKPALRGSDSEYFRATFPKCMAARRRAKPCLSETVFTDTAARLTPYANLSSVLSEHPTG